MEAVHRYGAWLIALGVVTANLIHAGQHGHLKSPPEPGDGADYDAVGWNLAQGRGFGVFWDDPEWRAPYEAALGDGRDDYASLLLRSGRFEPTTYRPPLFPVLLSGIYSMFGREFMLWRILNCVIGGAIAFLVFRLALRLGGPGAAWFAAIFFLIDPYQRHYAGLYLTENLATFLAVTLAYASLMLQEHPTRWRFLLVGVAVSVAVLSRGIFIFLLPYAIALVAWQCVKLRNREGWIGGALFGVALVLLLSPWWIRNCIVLDAPLPFGAQGWINMPAGYHDDAMSTGGNWDGDIRNRLYEEAGVPVTTELPLPERERRLAEAGKQITLSWISNHLFEVPMLVVAKIWTLWGSSRFGLLTLLAALTGLCFRRPMQDRLPLLFLLAIYTLGVGLTWTTGGRFRIPMMPLVFILAADACSGVAQMTLRAGRQRTHQ